MNYKILIFCALLVGCSPGRCFLNLAEENWSRTVVPSLDFVEQSDLNKYWFINAHGDYLMCPDVINGYCANVRKYYYKKEDGTYEEGKVIICIE